MSRTDVPVVGDAARSAEAADPRGRGDAPRRLDGLDRLAARPRARRGAGGPAGMAGAVHDHQGDRRGDQRRGDRHHRRRPASDVGGPALRVRPPGPLDHLRRSGHDGLRPAVGDRRQDRPAGPRSLGGRSATAVSRCRCNELATAVQENLDINIAIINNGYLGMVRQWQDLFHAKNYSEVKIGAPDFEKLAEAYGITGITRAHRRRDSCRRSSGRERSAARC